MKAEQIGERIREARESFKMSKRVLSEILNVPYRTVCSWEYGERVPCDEKKIEIAKLFGTSVEKLFYSGE